MCVAVGVDETRVELSVSVVVGREGEAISDNGLALARRVGEIAPDGGGGDHLLERSLHGRAGGGLRARRMAGRLFSGGHLCRLRVPGETIRGTLISGPCRRR